MNCLIRLRNGLNCHLTKPPKQTKKIKKTGKCFAFELRATLFLDDEKKVPSKKKSSSKKTTEKFSLINRKSYGNLTSSYATLSHRNDFSASYFARRPNDSPHSNSDRDLTPACSFHNAICRALFVPR